MKPHCPICHDTGWVCESHPDKAWTPQGCECGAGMPCRCNREDPPELPPDMEVGDYARCGKCAFHQYATEGE